MVPYPCSICPCGPIAISAALATLATLFPPLALPATLALLPAPLPLEALTLLLAAVVNEDDNWLSVVRPAVVSVAVEVADPRFSLFEDDRRFDKEDFPAPAVGVIVVHEDGGRLFFLQVGFLASTDGSRKSRLELREREEPTPKPKPNPLPLLLLPASRSLLVNPRLLDALDSLPPPLLPLLLLPSLLRLDPSLTSRRGTLGKSTISEASSPEASSRSTRLPRLSAKYSSSSP
mmetsp:Transcript_6645/g.13768  ORF Transcript_6645/g.13768 Transcript_6645/m.13768 type:complete len:233 (-) Transcript_6645:513-1211(-)